MRRGIGCYRAFGEQAAGMGRAGDNTAGQEALSCQRCGCAVTARPRGCKNPCTNCGFVYPLGDCSD